MVFNSVFKGLTVIAESLLLEDQNGFRKGRSCMDCVFSASQIIEKHRELNIPTYMAFIDFKKAFDSVDRDKELMQGMEYLKILELLPKG
jgi:hypothetical protein